MASCGESTERWIATGADRGAIVTWVGVERIRAGTTAVAQQMQLQPRLEQQPSPSSSASSASLARGSLQQESIRALDD